MHRLILGTAAVLGLAAALPADPPADAITPTAVTPLFNRKDLSGFTTWLKDTKHADPRKVFRVTDGLFHATGDGFGYAATEKAYRDYRLVGEYKWGTKTDGGKYVRNCGVLPRGHGADG